MREHKLCRALYWLLRYALSRNTRYRMYALNYLIDLVCHGRLPREVDIALHIMNEVLHGYSVEKSLEKALRELRRFSSRRS